MLNNISIPLNSKFKVYGSLFKSKVSANKLIIFIHGFLNNQDHHLFYNATRYFSHHGYDTFKYDLYNYKSDSRKADSTSFATYVEDLSKIVLKFKQLYSDITLVSHSLGAFISLLANPQSVSKFILWEPSLHPKQMFHNTKTQKSYYLFNLGYQIRIPKRVVMSMVNLPSLQIILSKIHKPIAIFSAKSTGEKIGKNYHSLINAPKHFQIIKHADHNFNNPTSEDILFKASLKWLNLSNDRKQH